MNLKPKRQIAARILKCGVNRVWIDPTKANEVAGALTKSDMRKLISQGVIRARPKIGTSRARARIIAIQKKKGRRLGHGSASGKKWAKIPRKERWITRIRALRRVLKELKSKKEITPRQYRLLYLQAGSGVFRSKAHMLLQVQKMRKSDGLKRK